MRAPGRSASARSEAAIVSVRTAEAKEESDGVPWAMQRAK